MINKRRYFISVHPCLFCTQTFDTAFDKDDHILQHFIHETCLKCNLDLIRIGGKLYAEHNTTTCIKISEPYVTYESIGIKLESSNSDFCELDEATIEAALDFDAEDQQIKTEPQHDEIINKIELNDLEARCEFINIHCDKKYEIINFLQFFHI